MIKFVERKPTRQELLDEVYELRRKVFELQQGGILVKEYKYVNPNDTTGDPLPGEPHYICNDDRGY